MFQLSLRTNPENPNHHLWNNNGTWFIHYVVHPTPFTKERIRKSLGTKSLADARAKRDAILSGKALRARRQRSRWRSRRETLTAPERRDA